VLDCSKSGRLKHLNITSLDVTSSENVVSLRHQVEKLVNDVQNHDATIQKLEQKAKSLKQQQNQQVNLNNLFSQPFYITY
jgi:septal ring factor EnvC (AmiA/AmiB activator)